MLDRARNWTFHHMFVGAGDSNKLSLINLFLVVVILAAVAVSIAGTEPFVQDEYHTLIVVLEILFGVIFSLEYLARVWSIADSDRPGTVWQKRLRFMLHPLAIIDLIVIVTSLMPFFFADVAVLRLLRLLRIIALAKFTRFNHAIEEITLAVWGRRYELIVTISLGWVLLLLGSVAMFWAEHEVQPEEFGSVLRALWWSVVTLTTVGYGDAVPITPLGRMLGGFIALCGVALVAMPAGIMAAAFTDSMQKKREEMRKLHEMARDVAQAEQLAREARAIATQAAKDARDDTSTS
jgi:voltage-gated potassium channel